MDGLTTFFKIKGLMPHGYCLIWNPLLLVVHVLSDFLIFIAYMIIPSIILHVKNRRNDQGINNLYTIFFLYILFCGITHSINMLVLWYPAYGIEGIMKFLTAIASITAAVFLYREKESLIKLDSPVQLEIKNKELQCLSNKLKELNQGLEQEIDKRVYEFKKVNEELLAFSYIISHDFRAPLRGIRQFSELLKNEYSDKLPDEAQEFLQIVHSSAVKSTNLLDSLTQFAKIGEEQEKKHRPINIKEIIDIIVVDNKKHIIENNVQVNINSNLPYIQGSRAHLHEILKNLIKNGIKYIDPQKEKRWINIHYCDEDNVLRIEDNGIGIPSDKINKCRNLFYKINPESEGLGMGLAICRKLSLVNNIEFELQNNQWGGVTATLKLQNYLVSNYEMEM